MALRLPVPIPHGKDAVAVAMPAVARPRRAGAQGVAVARFRPTSPE